MAKSESNIATSSTVEVPQSGATSGVWKWFECRFQHLKQKHTVEYEESQKSQESSTAIETSKPKYFSLFVQSSRISLLLKYPGILLCYFKTILPTPTVNPLLDVGNDKRGIIVSRFFVP